MRKYLAALAVLSIAAVAAAAPTYQHSAVDLGGGLFGHSFVVDNTGDPASGWFVEMEWWGASPAEIINAQCAPGSIPGSLINQQLAYPGVMDLRVDEEADAILYNIVSVPPYDMTLDSWIAAEFSDGMMSNLQGANYYERQSGSPRGDTFVVGDHAYIVSDGSVAFSGRLGVGRDDSVWTPVSGVSCVVPEPATMLLLGLGGLGAIIRRRR